MSEPSDHEVDVADAWWQQQDMRRRVGIYRWVTQQKAPVFGAQIPGQLEILGGEFDGENG